MNNRESFESTWEDKKLNAIENIPFEYDLTFDDALLYEAMCEVFYDIDMPMDEYRALASSIAEGYCEYEVTGWESCEAYVTDCVSHYLMDATRLRSTEMLKYINIAAIVDDLDLRQDLVETSVAVIRRKEMEIKLDVFRTEY